MELLEAAVSALKAGEEPSLEPALRQGPEVNLHTSAFIPDMYLPDVNARLTLYKRLASVVNDLEIQELKAEMIDRFGALPEPTQQLFTLAHLKLQLAHLGVIKVEVTDQYGYFYFNDTPKINPQKIIALIQKQPKNYQLVNNTTLRFKASSTEPAKRAEMVLQLISNFR